MRLMLLPLILVLSSLAGCAGQQSFSCISPFGFRNGGDVELDTRPATRNAAGYLHC